MQKTRQLCTLFALIFFSLNCFAFIGGIDDQITVPNSNFDLTFSVTNSDSVPRNLSLEVFLPFDYVFLEKPGVVPAGETQIVKLKVFPRKFLENSVFSGKIVANLGLQRVEKTFRIEVYNYSVCPLDVTVSGTQENFDGQEVFSILSRVENNSNYEVDFSIKYLRGIPSDWRSETQNSVLINAFETRVFRTTIFPNSSFSGNLEIVYLCNGQEISRVYPMDWVEVDFFSAGLIGLSGTIGSLPGGEFLFNIALLVVASVLMVMFISRLVRISVERSEPQVKLPSQRNNFEGESTVVFADKQSRKLEELKDLVAKEREARRK